MQIGSKLNRHGLVKGDGELDDLLDPHQRWTDKIKIVHEWMRNAKDELVILCDEPMQWPATGHPHFSHGAQDLIDELVFNGTGCDVVFAGRAPSQIDITHVEELNPSSDPTELLGDDKWGPLQESAARLLEVGASKLASFSPLQLRLIVALLEVNEGRTATIWLNCADIADLSKALFDHLDKADGQWNPLATSWQRLSRVRRPFDDDLLTAIEVDQLDECERTMLDHCLLYERHESRMLHETLRSTGREAGEPPEGEESLQDTLANYYRARVERLRADDSEWLADEMEAFHHASKGSEFDFERHQPFFVEQLNALGYHLSMEEHRYQDAVVAYERALQWSEDDDYAHHYLAFNLDIQPREPERVEKHYKRAVELSPSHHWWHASLVNFYAATGNFDRAREAWNAAKAEFDAADASLTVHQCQDLYMRVARTMLEFGQIEFCQAVLRGIPVDLREEVSGYRTIARMAEARRLARDHGNFVPGPLLHKHWWREGPFLIEPSKQLEQWMAGEIKQTGEEGVLVEAAIIDAPPDPDEHPPSGVIKITPDELQEWGGLETGDIEAGDFVEIVIEDRDGELVTQLRVHQQREWEDDSLPRLRPDPKRYL
jgi:tetratricopeptide (TPR) repeat protein